MLPNEFFRYLETLTFSVGGHNPTKGTLGVGYGALSKPAFTTEDIHRDQHLVLDEMTWLRIWE